MCESDCAAAVAQHGDLVGGRQDALREEGPAQQRVDDAGLAALGLACRVRVRVMIRVRGMVRVSGS